jgi:thiamine pyrophosphate-dependent acetolactate synthase large subunit-like protein
VQVDFDRMQLGKFHPVDEALWGDIGVTAALLHGRVRTDGRADQRAELADRWRLWREEKRIREEKDDGRGINSALIFKHLSDAAPERAILPVDVGNNTYSFGRYFECKEGQSVIMSGYLGSIGFGFPAAMGAWAANTGRPVISVSGDGGFGQYVGEFTTAVKYGMDITHVLLNNSELGKISKEQRDGEWRVRQTDLHNPNFAEYAALCGGVGIRVERGSDIPHALREAIAAQGPALVEVMADPALT